MADKYIFLNNYAQALAATLTVGGTSMTLDALGDLATPPAGFVQLLTLVNPLDPLDVEIVKVTAAAGNPVTIEREQEGTTAKEWPVGTWVRARLTAGMLGDLAQGIDNSGNARGTNAIDLQGGRDSDTAVASGTESVAVGYNNEASGNYSSAAGIDNVASGANAFAAGRNNQATAQSAVAVGASNQATAPSSVAVGASNQATGQSNQSIGSSNIVTSGGWSSALGFGNEITGESTRGYAVGYGNQITGGTFSFAAGRGNNVAGDYAVSFGYGNTVRGARSIASGYQAQALDLDALPAWAPSTPYSSYAVVRVEGVTNYYLLCEGFGTSGATAPVHPATADGTVTWRWVPYAGASDLLVFGLFAKAIGAGAWALGRSALAAGTDALAIGHSARAVGTRSYAAGHDARAVGEESLAMGYGAKAGPAEIVIGWSPSSVRGRNAENSVSIRGGKYRPFAHSLQIGGLEFVDQHDWWYSGAPDLDESLLQTTREITFYSVPFQLGDAGWPGAETVVRHGQAIRIGSKCYFAYCWVDGYFGSATTGLTEPDWNGEAPNPGDSLTDGNIDWICADPASIEFIIPDFTRFTPTRVGVIARWSTPGGTATYPQLTFGETGDLDSWLAATTLSKLTGDNSSHFVDPTGTVGAQQFGAAIATAGTDLDCTAVIAIKGFVVESQEA